MKHQVLKRLCAFLCVVLIIAYASAVFLPHTHDISKTDCAVCVLIEILRELLLGMALIAGIPRLIKCNLHEPNFYFNILSRREITPVGLKVKLSD